MRVLRDKTAALHMCCEVGQDAGRQSTAHLVRQGPGQMLACTLAAREARDTLPDLFSFHDANNNNNNNKNNNNNNNNGGRVFK